MERFDFEYEDGKQGRNKDELIASSPAYGSWPTSYSLNTVL